MKITFGMIVFNGNYVLKEAIESIYPYAHQILVAEGPVQYWQDEGYQTSNDGTNDVLSQLYDPDHKITIVHSQYKRYGVNHDSPLNNMRRRMPMPSENDCYHHSQKLYCFVDCSLVLENLHHFLSLLYYMEQYLVSLKNTVCRKLVG